MKRQQSEEASRLNQSTFFQRRAESTGKEAAYKQKSIMQMEQKEA